MIGIMAIEVIDTEIFLRLILAALAGGIVGFERRKVHKPAGLRTLMLVCVGSALFIIVTLQTVPDEIARIMGGIATGVGFLGAGTIFRDESHVRGLTTAASIWAVAAIGIACGLRLYPLMLAVTIIVVLILEINRIEFFREI